jgi:V/A-type H+/Na+-transporting ATPase subunit K
MMKLSLWILLVVIFGMLTVCPVTMAQEPKQAGQAQSQESVEKAIGLGAAAAFAITVSVLGAAYAVGRIGSAALGAAAEKPELLTRSIVLVALAEGLAVLGFAVAMLILQKI